MSGILKTSLLDLVGYQEGAVVSKTLIDKKTGTVTLFAFGDGQGLSEHTLLSMHWFRFSTAKQKSESREIQLSPAKSLSCPPTNRMN